MSFSVPEAFGYGLISIMDNIFETIFSLVEKDKINSKDEFDLFVSYLTNHTTPLREACAYKLEEIFEDKFVDENILEIVLSAIVDINPNVSRSVCKIINKSDKLQNELSVKIINKINVLLNEITKNQKYKNDKSHAKNKLIFSLYWLLEALYYCNIEKYICEISEILFSTFEFCDYTIREKSAQLLTKVKNPNSKLVEFVKNDKNFYVNFYTKFI